MRFLWLTAGSSFSTRIWPMENAPRLQLEAVGGTPRGGCAMVRSRRGNLARLSCEMVGLDDECERQW